MWQGPATEAQSVMPIAPLLLVLATPDSLKLAPTHPVRCRVAEGASPLRAPYR